MKKKLYKYKVYTVKITGETLISDLVIVRVMDIYAPDGRFLRVRKSKLEEIN